MESRLPAQYADRAPRIVRQKLKIGQSTGGAGTWIEAEDGDWGDVWHYEDVRAPMIQLFAAPGFGELAHKVTTYEQYQPGTWKQKERLEAMTANHVDAAVCFPNSLPRFAGQTFSERDDKELAFLCIEAYNDWMIDDRCAGEARGRLIPLTIVPLWDAHLADAAPESLAMPRFTAGSGMRPTRSSEDEQRGLGHLRPIRRPVETVA